MYTHVFFIYLSIWSVWTFYLFDVFDLSVYWFLAAYSIYLITNWSVSSIDPCGVLQCFFFLFSFVLRSFFFLSFFLAFFLSFFLSSFLSSWLWLVFFIFWIHIIYAFILIFCFLVFPFVLSFFLPLFPSSHYFLHSFFLSFSCLVVPWFCRSVFLPVYFSIYRCFFLSAIRIVLGVNCMDAYHIFPCLVSINPTTTEAKVISRLDSPSCKFGCWAIKTKQGISSYYLPIDGDKTSQRIELQIPKNKCL